MIRITRKWAYVNGFRAYKIFIDGVYHGKIKNGKTEEFEVENGRHTVCAKMDWVGSPDLIVEVNDSVVELEVGNTMDDAAELVAWPAYVTIWKDKYLFLIEKGALDAPQEGESKQ